MIEDVDPALVPSNGDSGSEEDSDTGNLSVGSVLFH